VQADLIISKIMRTAVACYLRPYRRNGRTRKVWLVRVPAPAQMRGIGAREIPNSRGVMKECFA